MTSCAATESSVVSCFAAAVDRRRASRPGCRPASRPLLTRRSQRRRRTSRMVRPPAPCSRPRRRGRPLLPARPAQPATTHLAASFPSRTAGSSTRMAASVAAAEASSGRLEPDTPSQTTAIAMAPPAVCIAASAIASSLRKCRKPRSVTPATRSRSVSMWSRGDGALRPHVSQYPSALIGPEPQAWHLAERPPSLARAGEDVIADAGSTGIGAGFTPEASSAAGAGVAGWAGELVVACAAASGVSGARQASQKLSPGQTGWPQEEHGLAPARPVSAVTTRSWAEHRWPGPPARCGARCLALAWPAHDSCLRG